METTGVLAGIAASAEKAACIREEDYRDKAGLWHCGRCHAPKQTVISWPGIPKPITVYCLCDCERKDMTLEQKQRAARERREKIKRESLSDMDTPAAKAMTLDADDRENPTLSDLARKYVESWETIRASAVGGMILWGSPGTGKTFYATAIGNELLKLDVTVARVSAAKIVEVMQGLYDYEKGGFVSTLNQNDLLILDDIGAERDTPFAREVIFSVVDNRCNLKKPIIATTNLTVQQMRDPKDRSGAPDMGYKRIFDRLLGAGTPVQVAGDSRRRQHGEEAREMMKEVMRR